MTVVADESGETLVERWVSSSGVAEVELGEAAADVRALRLDFTSDAGSADEAPRLLWADSRPRHGGSVRYAGRAIEQVDVLPNTGPVLLIEYPWPTRWLLLCWCLVLPPLVWAWRDPRRAVWLLAALSLAAAVTSALLWQRDYSRRAAHVDADQYARSASNIARYLVEPEARDEIREWYRGHPHATTSLVPAVMALPVALGAPVSLVYMELSAIAGFLSLWVLFRILRVDLALPGRVALIATFAFGCHVLMLRSFARPVTDAVGLLLALLTLWLLLRRLTAVRPRDEVALAMLLLCLPLARPQGLGYWPFVCVALLLCDRWREGGRLELAGVVVSQLRILAPPLLLLAALYLHFDWLHNVELMLQKAQRFRINSTFPIFAQSLVGLVQLLPLLWLRAGARLREPRVLLWLGWLVFNLLLLIAVGAPFWMRHFLPVLPVVFILAAAGLEPMRGRQRTAAHSLLLTLVIGNVAITVHQIYTSGPLPAWIERYLSTP